MCLDVKLLQVDALPGLRKATRELGKRLVLCHGAFSALAAEQTRLLAQAKALGDVLVVSLMPGFGPDEDRSELVSALTVIDHVVVSPSPTAVPVIAALRPDLYVRAPEVSVTEASASAEEAAVQATGGRMVSIGTATSAIRTQGERLRANLPAEADGYLTQFRHRYGRADVARYLAGARNLRVLVLGETIIDEYHYCQTIGKSGKEPILVARYVSDERFAGGILAVANHVAGFADAVSLVTCLGTVDSHADFINEKLHPGIQRFFVPMEGAPTIVKRRFLESYPLQKLFEVYIMNGDERREEQSRAICAHLKELLPQVDVVIVTDYGHGLFTPEVVDTLCQHARFLAVNTQANADNYGYNTVSKYRRADYVCVSESEIRLEARSRHRDLNAILGDIGRKLGCKQFLVTRGRQGSLFFHAEKGIHQVPALTDHFVDRVGAGDAVLAVTSLCVAQGAPPDLVGFVGNVVGAQAVSIVGNRSAVQCGSVLQYAEAVLG